MPADYFLYQWRKMMGISWQDAQDTPLTVVVRDLDFRGVELRVEKHFNEKQNA